MRLLRQQVLTVVALLFALSAGIALGGGPLSYVAADDAAGQETPRDAGESSTPPDDEAPAGTELADAFAGAAAPRLYGDALLGHPTAIVAMPGVGSDLVETMVAQVGAAGGLLTGVFQVTEQAVDRAETSLVDSLGSQLMTQLGDDRVSTDASTYVRMGELMSLAFATSVSEGRRADSAAKTVRASLGAAGLLTSPDRARLAPTLLVVLPPQTELEPEEEAARTAVYAGLATGMSAHAVGTVLLGDTASGNGGLLAALRADDLVASTVATVDGGDTMVGQVTAILALIASLDGTLGRYGASGSDGVVPLS